MARIRSQDNRRQVTEAETCDEMARTATARVSPYKERGAHRQRIFVGADPCGQCHSNKKNLLIALRRMEEEHKIFPGFGLIRKDEGDILFFLGEKARSGQFDHPRRAAQPPRRKPALRLAQVLQEAWLPALLGLLGER